ncbi:MAG: dockerin type I repeat-containing protein [Clostridia bacterium]|nr:dockerin type I repeat-containing protein [Clostridia bacterium]
MTIKRISTVLILVIMAAVMTVSAAAESPGALPLAPGDVDRNGKVEAADARQALRFSVRLDEQMIPECASADVDGDDVVTAADARHILRCAVGLEKLAVPQTDDGTRGAAYADIDTAIASVLRQQYRSEAPDGLIHVQSYCLLDCETISGTPEEQTVWLIVYHMTYSMMNGEPKEAEGGFIPAAVTFAIREDGAYILKEYWTPEPGESHASHIRAKFPSAAADEVLNIGKYAEALKSDNRDQVTEYLKRLHE